MSNFNVSLSEEELSKVSAASKELLNKTIIPAMGTDGSRMLSAKFTICV